MLTLVALVLMVFGCVLWWKCDSQFISPTVVFSILIISFGSALFVDNIGDLGKFTGSHNKKQVATVFHWIFVLAVIYLGTAFYTIAAYYHLTLKNWSFLNALIIALPIVFMEYQFSLRGNFYARKHLALNAVQILLITTIFAFINNWLLNYFVLKHPLVWWRETVSLALIAAAFLITTSLV